MEALSALTNMAKCRAQRQEIEAWIKSLFEMDGLKLHHSFEGGKIMNTATFSSLRMRGRSDDWGEQIVQEFFSEWLADFRVRLLPRRQDSLTNENTEY